MAIDGSTVLVGESNGEDPDGVVFDGSRARSGVVHVFSSDASLWSSGALGSTGSSSGGSSGGSDSNTGAIVAGCVFGAFALLFVGAVAYFSTGSPGRAGGGEGKILGGRGGGREAGGGGEGEVLGGRGGGREAGERALFAKAEAEGEPETAAEEAAAPRPPHRRGPATPRRAPPPLNKAYIYLSDLDRVVDALASSSSKTTPVV